MEVLSVYVTKLRRMLYLFIMKLVAFDHIGLIRGESFQLINNVGRHLNGIEDENRIL